jgi:hypothetical protein
MSLRVRQYPLEGGAFGRSNTLFAWLMWTMICVRQVETVSCSTMAHGPAEFFMRLVNHHPQIQSQTNVLPSTVGCPARAPASSPEMRRAKLFPLFDMGFLQIMHSELFKEDCDDRRFPSVNPNLPGSPCYSAQRSVQVVIDYRKNKITRGINSVLQTGRDICTKIYDTRNYLLAGAVGRCVAVSVMFPVDTIKTRLQMYGSSCCTPSQWSQALRLPIYNGVSSSLMGQVRFIRLAGS